MVMLIALALALPLTTAGAMVVRHDPGAAALLWSVVGLVSGLAWLASA